MSKKDQRYWFRTRKSGWTWGLPQNLKGWVSYGVFVAIWLGALAWLISTQSDYEITASSYVIFAAIIVADVAGLLYVSYKFGELPKLKRSKKRGTTKS